MNRTRVILAVLAGWIGYHLWASGRALDPRRPLDKHELELVLQEKYELVVVSLDEGPSGRLAGMGNDRRGKTYHFEVIQGQQSREVVATWGKRNGPNGYGESHWTVNW